MTQEASAPAGKAEPCFDVLVSLGRQARLEDVRSRAQTTMAMPPDKVEALMRALERQYQVKVGQQVPKARADKARRDLESVGLVVELRPVLELEAVDNSLTCPHCNTRVMVPEDRMCPACGRHVDRANPARKLADRIEAEERERLERLMARERDVQDRANAKAMEVALRARIRAELEREYGLHHPWRRRLLKLRTSFVVSGLLAFSLAVGLGGAVLAQVYVRSGAMPDIPRMLTDDLDAALALLDKRTGQAPGGAASAASGVVDPSVGVATGAQSLSQHARQERATGDAVIEQALTRAPWGEGQTQADGSALGAPQLAGADRARYTENFALQLARMGQTPRAREVLAAMARQGAADGGGEPAPSSSVLVEAWGLQQPGAIVSSQRVQMLNNQAQAIADPAERSRALAGSAAALAQSPQIPDEVADAFLGNAAQAIRETTDPAQRMAATEAWYTSMADVLHARARQRAMNGDLAGASVAMGQLEGLRRQMPIGAALAHITGLQHHGLRMLGQAPQARQLMADTLARSARIPDVLARAEFLRQLAQACRNEVPDELLTAAAELSTQLETAPDGVRNQAYLALARLAVAAGRQDAAGTWRKAGQARLPVDPRERARLQASWLVDEQLALADHAQRTGKAGQAELHVRKVAAYLM